MGVPSFCVWLIRRYPKILKDVIEPASKSFISIDESNPNGMEFDNLYLDMNGIIHPCCHPQDGKSIPPKNEEEMFERICIYIDRIVKIIRPHKLLYLAIDGVAPRAKMNQQRARRFRAGKEIDIKNQIAKEYVKHTKKTWDSNVITPGTPFMYKLSIKIRSFIKKKNE